MTTLPQDLKLDSEIEERLHRLAAARNRPADWLMREAVKQYVEREEAGERFAADALAAWAAYERNGEHITGEEVDAWLGCLEADEDCPAPEPHD